MVVPWHLSSGYWWVSAFRVFFSWLFWNGFMLSHCMMICLWHWIITPQYNLGRVFLFFLCFIWWFCTLFSGFGTGSWGKSVLPNTSWVEFLFFLVAFLVDLLWENFGFFSTNTTWCFFWKLALVPFLLLSVFFSFFYACWWLSRLHNLRVGSKLRLENSGLVQRSVLGAVFLVCGGVSWYRLSFAWWSVCTIFMSSAVLDPFASWAELHSLACYFGSWFHVSHWCTCFLCAWWLFSLIIVVLNVSPQGMWHSVQVMI